MSTGLGLSGEGQDRGGEGEHKVGPSVDLLKTPEREQVRREHAMSWPLFSHGFPLLPRTLCDNLRRERDRAVSDLADALRNLDDMRKQKNDALRELKELK